MEVKSSKFLHYESYESYALSVQRKIRRDNDTNYIDLSILPANIIAGCSNLKIDVSLDQLRKLPANLFAECFKTGLVKKKYIKNPKIPTNCSYAWYIRRYAIMCNPVELNWCRRAHAVVIVALLTQY